MKYIPEPELEELHNALQTAVKRRIFTRGSADTLMDGIREKNAKPAEIIETTALIKKIIDADKSYIRLERS